jgi:hypothetical protein
MLFDENGVPLDWEYVTLDEDLDAFCDAADAGDMKTVAEIVERAYDRAYSRLGAEILASAN